jgi:hypothetical protein
MEKNLLDYGLSNDHAYLFVKFSKKKYLEMLQSGTLHMKNFKAYIDWEKKHGKKGIGDVLEATHVMSNTNIQILHPETEEVLIEGIAARLTLTFDDLVYKPVFCLTGINASALKLVDESEDYIEVSLNYSEEEKKTIIEEFGDYALVISPKQFMDTVTKKLDELGYSYKAKFVKYDDYTVNNKERFEDFLQFKSDLYFWKDEKFKYQREYRLVILNKDIEEPLNIDIGDISSFTVLIPTEKLFSDYTMRFPKVAVTNT